jgi:DNA-binding GntR family transcriptional regulator
MVMQPGNRSGDDALTTLEPAGRLVDRVHGAIRRAILNGGIGPGQALSVPDLSRRLAVSRSPVREAVLQLVADGIAIETPRKGVVVQTITAQDLAEIHAIREFLEALSARWAAERATAANLKMLAAVLYRQDEAIRESDAERYFSTNADFHRLIGEATGSTRLITMLGVLENQMALALRGLSANPTHGKLALAEHRRILEAICSRDGDAAETAMRTHVANTRLRIIDGD